MSKLLTVSPSPHIYGKDTTPNLMYGVIIALIPAILASIFYFGWGAVIVISVAVISSVLFEFLIQRFLLQKKTTIQDGSAVITGLLLALCLPSNFPVLLIISGSLFAIGVGKLSFGGLGNNPFNPALVGRVFLFISFPAKMTSWPQAQGFQTQYVDASTGATPLSIIKEGLDKGDSISQLMDKIPTYPQLFIGDTGGSIGEIAAVALILGLVYLLLRKIITWHIPVSIILTVVIFTGILWLVDPSQNADPLFHILSGGILLGAIFMATDYVTSPMTTKGMIAYGISIGILTVVIRRFGSFPEGVQFAILIMNGFVPLINYYIKPKRFGEEVKNG
ncbi:MAG: RnfABCDGE type electron transport complex subunit D [Bacteroidetes bacterium]|nr:RnfABCDGE type electron transport complex subunit D [Bacteroidota bacterium]